MAAGPRGQNPRCCGWTGAETCDQEGVRLSAFRGARSLSYTGVPKRHLCFLTVQLARPQASPVLLRAAVRARGGPSVLAPPPEGSPAGGAPRIRVDPRGCRGCASVNARGVEELPGALSLEARARPGGPARPHAGVLRRVSAFCVGHAEELSVVGTGRALLVHSYRPASGLFLTAVRSTPKLMMRWAPHPGASWEPATLWIRCAFSSAGGSQGAESAACWLCGEGAAGGSPRRRRAPFSARRWWEVPSVLLAGWAARVAGQRAAGHQPAPQPQLCDPWREHVGRTCWRKLGAQREGQAT